jgi:hypothetical protein
VQVPFRKIILSFACAASLAAAAILYPQPLFAYSQDHGAFTVYSDRPIEAAMGQVIDDAERRLRSSDLYDPTERFRVFVCNEPWRLFLLARNMSVGGKTDTLFTRNIYIREADAAANRVLIGSEILADAEARPLSYFIAQEAAHVIQSRRFGRFMVVRYPRWLIEGHADLVAKAGDFDSVGNRALLNASDPLLAEDFARRGLYRWYHLMVLSLMQQGGKTEAELFANAPPESAALRAAQGGIRSAADARFSIR